MKDPVVPLKLALYGHPDSGKIWERHCETELRKVGFEAVLTDIWKSVFYHPTKKLLLVVYVDVFQACWTQTEHQGRLGPYFKRDRHGFAGSDWEVLRVCAQGRTQHHAPFRHVFEPPKQRMLYGR